MVNPLYLPELREMLAENDAKGLANFCEVLHPARAAEFMEGLDAEETWGVLEHADIHDRRMIFGFIDEQKQVEMIETLGREEMAELIGELPPDDRVDMLEEVEPEIVDELLPLVPTEERRDIQRLSAYPEDTAGAVMTTEFASLDESSTVEEAFAELSRQAEELETIYYLYVVDDSDHLRGLVSARQLVSSMGRPTTRIGDLMDRDLVVVSASDDQEYVAAEVAKYDLLAIPVVDKQHRLVGIITHDDIIDVVREEATEDAHRIAGIEPLEEGYLETPIIELVIKRGIWLAVLFFGALLTAGALLRYDADIVQWQWLVLFLPLIISTGGNSGNQSATLIITALSMGDIELRDWLRVVRREMIMGLILGGVLGVFGYFSALIFAPDPAYYNALVLPITILLVVVSGVFLGGTLPLIFRRFGLDPALMSNPFVAGIIDLLGIIIYMNVARAMLAIPAGG